MKKTTLKKRIEILEKEVQELRVLIPRRITGTGNSPIYGTSSTMGEWCSACGAWKQYGFSDNHYCTGYKITC